MKRTDIVKPRPKGAWEGCAMVSGSPSGCHPNRVSVVPPHAPQRCSPTKAGMVAPASQLQSSGCAALQPFMQSIPGKLNRLGDGFWSKAAICIRTSHFAWKFCAVKNTELGKITKPVILFPSIRRSKFLLKVCFEMVSFIKYHFFIASAPVTQAEQSWLKP